MAEKELKGKGGERGIFGLILVCFFFSGMTGLIYEIVWTRMIVKVIGGAPFAISIILTVFMAGLGLGSFIAGKLIDKIKEPLRLVRIYGVLELIIGVYCFVLSWLLVFFKPAYSMVYQSLFEHFAIYSLVTFLSCGLLLIIPVICMGATLPILCRFYVRRLGHLGGHAGRLYGLNTIGGAAGSVVCGFWLLAHFGMGGTVAAAVAVNVVIGAVTIAASYVMKGTVEAGETAARPGGEAVEQATSAPASIRGIGVLALVIFAVSGFCSMSYEVIWAKVLGLIIGPTTYSFTIVLVTFITGLAIGSIVFGRLGDRVKSPMRLLVYSQFAAAIFALMVSQVLGNSQFFFAKLIYQFQDNFAVLHILKAGVLFLFMVVPTVCLGATFPLVGKIYTRSISGVGQSIGFAYAINTIGAVLGSFCAGFILVPFVGKENGLRIVVLLQVVGAIVAGGWYLWFSRSSKAGFLRLIFIGGAAVVLCGFFPSWNRAALSRGRYHRIDKSIIKDTQKSGWLEAIVRGADILGKDVKDNVVYYGDGIAGFTTVLERRDMFGNTNYSLVISGKADASSDADMPTQTLSAHFPMMFHPGAKDVMVLGYASGITAGEVLCYPVERMDVLEISGEVMEASRFFDRWNGNVLDNPRTHVIVQDGRAHLELSDRSYDVIISEPSNPWMAGLAALFTEDFFLLAKERLNADGIFVQFIHSYQMDWNSFSMVCRTFGKVYPKNALIETTLGDYLMIGFKGLRGFDLNVAKNNLRFAKNSRNVSLTDARILYSLIATEDLSGLAGEGDVHSDEWPRLEFSSPKALFAKNEEIIKKEIILKRKVSPTTQSVLQMISNDTEAQISMAELALSLNNPFANMVNLSQTTAEQKERYFKLVEEYAADHTLDYSFLGDLELAKRCRMVQIDSIENGLESLRDKGLGYYSLGDLYRDGGMLLKAEESYRKALEYYPNEAGLNNDLAVVLHYQGKLADAVEFYDRALKLKPDAEDIAANREKALAKLGEQRANGAR